VVAAEVPRFELAAAEAAPCFALVAGIDAFTLISTIANVDRKYMFGLVTQNDMLPLLAQADIVVLPSYREGTPRILIEAAAMARVPLAGTSWIPGQGGL